MFLHEDRSRTRRSLQYLLILSVVLQGKQGSRGRKGDGKREGKREGEEEERRIIARERRRKMKTEGWKEAEGWKSMVSER